ncbi:hypothetical protein BDV96DRAFT_589140 [Lophiotrema nucula]|uniref:Aminoglycoside phosphotransferase domain-containing protein n=1 Tax=Lophiotrema nucula TaxID=690887 RepID=A0A6A5YN79_9PLEO|nr:hypothetical protein BDV96DRAFT_589140 [Lophiotrema nucula]
MNFERVFNFRNFMDYFNRTGPVDQGQNARRMNPQPPVVVVAPISKQPSKLHIAVVEAAANAKAKAKEMFGCFKKHRKTKARLELRFPPMTLTIATVKEIYSQEPISLFHNEGHSIVPAIEVVNEVPDDTADDSDTGSVIPDTSSDKASVSSVNTSQCSEEHDECEDRDDDCEADDSDEEDDTDDDDDSDDEDDEDDDDDELPLNPRADWTTIEAITDVQFRKVLARHLSKSKDLKELQLDNIECINIAKGSFHHVRIFEVKTEEHVAKYCVKVPVAGTDAFWCDIDAQTLRSEAQTMMYIRKHTKVPVPEVIGYDSTFENELGAPFTIMTAIEGRPAYEVFYENATDSIGDAIWLKPDEPDADRTKKRRTVLTTLAQAMAQLSVLKFDHTGMLTFAEEDTELEHPIFVPAWEPKQPKKKGSPDELSAEQLREEAAFVKHPVEESVDKYFENSFAKVFPEKEDSTRFYKGERNLMSALLTCPPFFHDEEEDGEDEYFVLSHVDLNFQNIFVNDEGEVTAIIDWSNCRIVPRCLGYASLPRPLTTDWDMVVKGLKYDVTTEVHAPWVFEEYRTIYADAMLAATGDGKYTLKSVLYHAIDKALHDEDDDRLGCVNLLEGILLQIPGTRMAAPLPLFGLLDHGLEGYQIGYNYLVREIGKLVVP